jgi:hypothetical protein
MTTDDLRALPHIVVLSTLTVTRLFEFEGADCQERAHVFAQKLALEHHDGRVIVAAAYRTITGPRSHVGR